MQGLYSEVTVFLISRNWKQCALISHLTLSFFCYKAGKKTTDEELEEMLESGNPAIFTSGVGDSGGHQGPPRGYQEQVASGGGTAGTGRQRGAGQERV